MRRTKSILFVLVMALMVFGMVSAAYAAANFSDISTDPAKNDITKLNALGVINGYPDGTFQPAGEITRAEFAKIAVILAGMETSGDIMKNSASPFSDVPAGQWFTGWVNVAASQGYVKGYADGTFKPDAKVTAAEVITVMVRLLGYDDRLPGDWPVDYLSKAGKLGITDDLSFVGSAPATRALVCQLGSATLDEDIVDYDNDKEDFFAKEKDLTLLSDNFDEGLVVEDVLVKAVKFSGDEYKMDTFSYDSDLEDETDAKRTVDNLSFADNVVVAGVPSIFALEGSIVNYIVNDDDEVVFVELADGITKVFGRVDSYDLSGSKMDSIEIDSKDYDFNDKFFGCLSKMTDKSFTASDFSAADKAFFDASLVDFKVTVYLDADNEVVFVYRTSPDASYVVDSVDTKNGEIDPLRGPTIKDMDSEDDFIIVKNGAPIKLEDVKPGNVFYNVASGDNVARGFDRYIVVVDSSVTGEFSRYNEDDVDNATDEDSGIIGDTKYDFASVNASDSKKGLYLEDESGDEVDYSDINDLLGSDVTAYLDGNKEIAYITGQTGDGGKLEGAIESIGNIEGRSSDQTNWVEIFTADGKEVSYDIESDYWDDDSAAIKAVCGNFDTGTPKSPGVMVKYSLNADGLIDDISLLDDDEDIDVGAYNASIGDPEKDFDRLKVNGAWKYLKDDTVIIDMVYDDKGEADPELATWADIEDTNILKADVYYDGEDITDIVIKNVNGISESDIYGLFTGTYKNSDGDWMAEFYVDGELAEYEVTDAVKAKLSSKKGYTYNFNASSGKISSVSDINVDGTSYEIADDGVNSNSLDLLDYGTVRFDSDTFVVEKDGSDYSVITIDDLTDGDIVRVLEGKAVDDEDGIAKIVVLLSDEDKLSDVGDAFDGGTNPPPADDPSGTYAIADNNQFTKAMTVVVENLDGAAFFNVYKGATALANAPVAIDGKIVNISAMFSDVSALTVKFYSDAAGANQVATATLNNGELTITE